MHLTKKDRTEDKKPKNPKGKKLSRKENYELNEIYLFNRQSENHSQD